MPALIPNRWTTDPKYIELLSYLMKRTENVESPINIKKLVREFKEKSGTSQTLTCLKSRVERMRTIIHGFKHIDTNTKVKLMIALSASVNADFLEELKKNASVEVDEKNRITKYKSIDWNLELRGNHSKSEKMKIAMREIELKRNYRKLISDYFENDDDADTFPKKTDEKEMWNLIEFITRKCGTVDSPLSIGQLTKDFNKHFGILRTFDCIYRRVKAYCNEIQRLESLDTLTKIKQLFCLSARLDSEFLQELRKDAVVEVDHQNRITKYTANNGRFSLHGDHSQSAKSKLTWSEKRKNKNAVKKYCISGDYDEKKEKEIDPSEDESEEYSSEEFGSEFDSDDDNDHLDESEDLIEQSKETNDFDIETPIRNRSKMSIEYIFDFDLPTKRSHRSEENKTRKVVEEKNDPKINENSVIKTRSGRLSKRRHLDLNFSYDLANSSSSGALMSSSSSYSKPAKINNYTSGSSLSKRAGEFSNDSMRPNELDDYDPNYSIDDGIKLEPFRGIIQEDLSEIKEDEDIQYIPKPHQDHNEQNQIEEVSIKVEPEEPKIVENPTGDVKPEIAQALGEHERVEEVPIKMEHVEPVDVKPKTSHNSKIKFLEAMKSLIVCLDTPSLSWIQSKINQKIQKLEGPDEVILNNEIVLIIDLLITRMTNHSVVNRSKNMESVNLSNFLCYLKVSILNSKLSGVEGLVRNISKLIEESHNKRIPMETVSNSLLATLDAYGF